MRKRKERRKNGRGCRGEGRSIGGRGKKGREERREGRGGKNENERIRKRHRGGERNMKEEKTEEKRKITKEGRRDKQGLLQEPTNPTK